MKRIEQYDVFPLPVSQIYYDVEFNCRGQFTLQSVEDLAKSIEENRVAVSCGGSGGRGNRGV